MNINRTLYISDLDGTLLNKNAELSLHTKNILNQMISDGVCFSVATARTAATALKILDGVDWNFPLVLLNGVLAYDTENNRYTQILTVNAKTVGIILTVFDKMNVTGLMYRLSNNEQMTYYESLENKALRDFVELRRAKYNKGFIHTENFSDLSFEDVIYFTVIDTYEKIMSVHDALSDILGINPEVYKDIYSPDLWFLEVFSSKASKYNAVIKLRETYGFDRVVGFGDNLNDLPLFEACDVKVAVQNANPKVKADADYICEANDKDGVVKWIAEDLRE